MAKVDRSTKVLDWMDAFKKIHPEVEYVELINGVPAAQFLDSLYWEKLDESVKPYMARKDPEGRVDRHKIASLWESIIAFCQPIAALDGTEDGPVNPSNFEFAYFVAQTIMDSFNLQRGIELDYYVSDEFDREHLSLLGINTSSDAFVFSNAASWYLIEQYCINTARPV